MSSYIFPPGRALSAGKGGPARRYFINFQTNAGAQGGGQTG